MPPSKCVKCLECERYSFKAAPPRMASVGVGKCSRDKAGEFKTPKFLRTCGYFVQATQERINSINQWLEKKEIVK